MHHSPFSLRNLGLGPLTLGALLLVGCNSKPITVDAPPPPMAQPIQAADGPENMLDWNGTYQAILPCDDCQGIAMSVQLRADKTAVVRERKVGKPGAAMLTAYSGPFGFSPAGGSLIALRKDAASPVTYRFFVGENWIEMRNPDTGAALTPASAYRLAKTSIEP